METTQPTDEACERVISGRMSAEDDELKPVRWLVEDLRAVYMTEVSRAARALHPSTSKRLPAAPAYRT